MKSSNYNAFFALSKITWKSIATNGGFYFSLILTTAFVVLIILTIKIDKRKLSKNFLETLYLDLHRDIVPVFVTNNDIKKIKIEEIEQVKTGPIISSSQK